MSSWSAQQADPAGRLKGGVAVITGAGGGLGEGLAHVMGDLGMKLVLADISQERLDAVVADLTGKGIDAFGLVTDVADPAALDRLCAAAQARHGPVRLLINNAGIETLGLAWELSAEAWARTININVLGVINGARAFVPHMLAAGEQAFIVNIASIASVSQMGVQTPDIVSKHAVLSFSECLSLELGIQSTPIQVSAVLPGPIATRIFKDAPESNASVTKHRELMDSMLEEQGLTPVEAARMIVDQMLSGKFWIATHPEMLADAADRRADYLKARQAPELSDEARYMMTV